MSTPPPATEPVKTSIAPWLSVRSVPKALAFYQEAFGAVEQYRLQEGGRMVVARLDIDGADFWIQEDEATTPDSLGGIPVRMIITVDDPDSLFDRALAAGATELVSVAEAFGWRIGRIEDPFGHQWEIGKPVVADD
jgi:PhnB protein